MFEVADELRLEIMFELEVIGRLGLESTFVVVGRFGIRQYV